MSETIGIKLRGGPDPLDGWQNIYDGDMLGGWPPPERIAAFEPDFAPGLVAVARTDDVPEDYEDKVTLYRKVQQSTLTEPDPDGILTRGAVYEVES